MTAFTLKMYAPNGAIAVKFIAQSGNSYTSDSYGVISGVLPGDVTDLENAGCLSLGVSQVLGLPWVSGRFYGLQPGNTQAAVLTVLGTLYAIPIFIPNAITLATLNVSVTTGQTGGKARGALFYDNGAGYPGAIVPGSDTGDLDGTGTAVVTKSGLALHLPAGWYWYGSIYTASSTMPSVIGGTAVYPNLDNALLGCDTAAHALATSGQAVTGIAKTGQTYPAVDMATSFPTFPASAALTINATTPIAALGV